MVWGMTLRFLSRGEIAERLGVTLGTVKQYSTFPEPDVIVGRNQGWAPETVDRWAESRKVARGLLPHLRVPAAEDLSGLPAGDCGLGSVPEDFRAGADDLSGTEPASLSAAPLSGAGAEAPHRIVESTEDYVGPGIHDGASVVGVRRGPGVDRRGRGV